MSTIYGAAVSCGFHGRNALLATWERNEGNPEVYPRIGNADQSLTCHSRALGIALTNMGEVVSLGKACFAPPNAIAYADAMAGHRFAMLEMAALHGP